MDCTHASAALRDYEVRSENLRPHPDSRTQAKGYPIAPLADAWRRYLPPLDPALGPVTNVTTVTRDVFERYFEVVVVTPVTEVTDPEAEIVAPSDGAGDLPEQLDAKRVRELVRWWCTRTKQLWEELSPAQVEVQIRKELRETLAEQVQESALDAEVSRIEKAANKAKRAGSKPNH
jgi:hypothetical protein